MVLLAAACLLIGFPPLAREAEAASPDKPNIIMFYIDDVDPHDGRLWNDASRTPAIVEHFLDHGLTFTNAIVEDPLCCPARGNLLTGLHTHNNGVYRNDARLFDPRVHIGHAMQDAGYSTMFLGKYLNRNPLLTTAQWKQHDAGWTHFDVIRNTNGRYYDYKLYTKDQGILGFGQYHSTRMVAERFVTHLRQTPADQPAFAILSIYNLHGPNTPFREHIGDPRCASIPPWNPPNYNEANVSDKPIAIRELPRLTSNPDGWPMVKYCEEMLSVDWAVQKVTDELEAQGRLDNTLLVFAGDNGIGWGAHRVPQRKMLPYTTPVPLYMAWPARWGTEPRAITEHTSNIDLAPTFCAVGGCTLGPFRSGQAGPDGVNLMPLLDGSVENLGRTGLLEVQLDPDGIGATPQYGRTWTAIRTTALHPAGLWHYVEWSTGERELYDLANDPWELESRHDSSTLADLRSTLSAELAALRAEGRLSVPTDRPDAMIQAPSGEWKRAGFYSSTPVKAQTSKRTGVARGASYDYPVRVEGSGEYSVSATESGTARMKVTYWVDGLDVSTAVRAGTYSRAAPFALTVSITIGPRAKLGSRRKAVITAHSTDGLVDVVRAVAVR